MDYRTMQVPAARGGELGILRWSESESVRTVAGANVNPATGLARRPERIFMEHTNVIAIPNHLGQIVAEIDLPDGWERGKKTHRPSYLLASRFFLSDRDERVAITLREPAKKTYHFMEPQHNHFLQMLRRPAHELSDDEMLTIHLLLEQAAWPAKFKRDWARTIFYPPHNILQIQGLWVQERIRSRAIILDTTFDSGNFVQEIWFVAPAEVFDVYAAECERIFSSFRWTIATEELTATPWAASPQQ